MLKLYQNIYVEGTGFVCLVKYMESFLLTAST